MRFSRVVFGSLFVISPFSALAFAHFDSMEEERIQRRRESRESAQPAKTRVKYLILGSGTAAQAALETLRLGDPHAKILMIAKTSERTLPRMDASKREDVEDLSPLEQRLRGIYDEWRRQLNSSLDENDNDVPLMQASRISIDVEERVVTVMDQKIEYEKCLVATAGKPRDFYVLDRDRIACDAGLADNAINTLHDALDFKNLADTVSQPNEDGMKKHVTVVGGGFLGTEVVAALADSGTCRVTHIMGERSPLAHYLPQYLSEYITKRLIHMGVDVQGEVLVTGIKSRLQQQNDHHHPAPATILVQPPPVATTAAAVSLARKTRSQSAAQLANATVPEEPLATALIMTLVGSNQVDLGTDYMVLASTNVTPDLMGLERPGTGLEIADGGIVTNSSLQAYHGLYVAGNSATYFDSDIGRRRRVDAFEHAVASGMWAANNMLATEKDRVERYTHQPSVKATLPGTGLAFESVGKIDAKLETVGVWYLPEFSSSPEDTAVITTPATAIIAKDALIDESSAISYRRGVVYYIERGRVVGVLLCNASEMVDRARDVLKNTKVLTDPKSELPEWILLAPKHWLRVVQTR